MQNFWANVGVFHLNMWVHTMVKPMSPVIKRYVVIRLRLVRGLRLRTTIALVLTPLRSVRTNAKRIGRLYSHDSWYKKGQVRTGGDA